MEIELPRSFVMHCMIANHYFDGANYPVGGSRMIAETIIPVIKKNGGDLIKNCGVDKIWIENNTCKGVLLENGDKISSQTVISTAGVANTISKFLRDEEYLKDYKDNLKNVKPSSGHACLYIGFNQSAKDLGIKDTNLWVYPSYDHDSTTEKFQKNQDNDFPVLYMSFASAKDPDWDLYHPNTATMEVIVPSGFEHYEKWKDMPWRKRGEDYEDYKDQLCQRMIKSVYTHCPHLKDKISYYELSTPLSTKTLANYKFGELYGIDHDPQRFNQKWLKPKTPIKNLYLSGQDILTVGSLKTGRHFIHIDDIVRAILISFHNSGFNIFNVQGKDFVTLDMLIKESTKLLNKNIQIKETNSNAPSIRKMSLSKTKKKLQYRPNISYKQGVREIINFFKNDK